MARTMRESNQTKSSVSAWLRHQFLPTDKSNRLTHSSFTMEEEVRSGTAHPEKVDREILMFYWDRENRISRGRDLGTRLTKPLRFVTTEPVFSPPKSYQIILNQENPYIFDWNLNCTSIWL